MNGKPKHARVSNPLLADPVIHPDLKRLFDALVKVSVWSSAVANCYPELLSLKESCGLPKPSEWPDSPVLERRRAQHAERVDAEQVKCVGRGDSVAEANVLEPEWTEKMREWSGCYREWCAAIAKAKELAETTAVAVVMDAGESRPAHRWTTQTILNLDRLAGKMHPIGAGGVDGLGFIRCGLPPLPEGFHALAESVVKRIGELRSIPVSTVSEVPAVLVSPDSQENCGTHAVDFVARKTASRASLDDETTVIVLSEIAARVLGFLSGQSTARARVYIADSLPADRRAVAAAVNELKRHCLVEDRGRQRGIAITLLGRNWHKVAQSTA